MKHALKILAIPHSTVVLKLYRFPSPLGEGLGVRENPHFRVALISRLALTPFIKLTCIKASTPPSPDGEGELDAPRSKIPAIPHLSVVLKLYRFPSPLGEGLGVRAIRLPLVLRTFPKFPLRSQSPLIRHSSPDAIGTYFVISVWFPL